MAICSTVLCTKGAAGPIGVDAFCYDVCVLLFTVLPMICVLVFLLWPDVCVLAWLIQMASQHLLYVNLLPLINSWELDPLVWVKLLEELLARLSWLQ